MLPLLCSGLQVAPQVHVYGHTHIPAMGQTEAISSAAARQAGAAAVEASRAAPAGGAGCGGGQQVGQQQGQAGQQQQGQQQAGQQQAGQQHMVRFVHNPLDGSRRPGLCCVWDGQRTCCVMVDAASGQPMPA